MVTFENSLHLGASSVFRAYVSNTEKCDLKGSSGIEHRKGIPLGTLCSNSIPNSYFKFGIITRIVN